MLREIVIRKLAVTALALAPDRRFAYAGHYRVDGKGKSENLLSLWDLDTGKEVKRHAAQSASVRARLRPERQARLGGL